MMIRIVIVILVYHRHKPIDSNGCCIVVRFMVAAQQRMCMSYYLYSFPDIFFFSSSGICVYFVSK
jgi:hypothetical protein